MRGRSLGQQMKLFQREWALEHGIWRIHWTFDPLETANARLNIAKLGGVVRRYVRDCYGELPGSLTGGIPTDRFVLEWDLQATRPDPLVPASTVRLDDAPARQTPVGVQVPLNLQQLKADAPQEARRWRLHTRAVFEALLAERREIRHFVVQSGYGVYIVSEGE
ncbi:MAG: hypothetical protein ACYCW6_27710, partial [Candidatus Xenobia bacterium]